MTDVLEERVAGMAEKLTEVHTAVTGADGLMVRLVRAEQTLDMYGKVIAILGTGLVGLGVELATRLLAGGG